MGELMINKCLEFLDEVEEMGYVTSSERSAFQRTLLSISPSKDRFRFITTVENRLVVFEYYDGVVYLNIPDVEVHLSR